MRIKSLITVPLHPYGKIKPVLVVDHWTMIIIIKIVIKIIIIMMVRIIAIQKDKKLSPHPRHIRNHHRQDDPLRATAVVKVLQVTILAIAIAIAVIITIITLVVAVINRVRQPWKMHRKIPTTNQPKNYPIYKWPNWDIKN